MLKECDFKSKRVEAPQESATEVGNWINVKRQMLGPYAIDAASDSEQLSEILCARQRGGGRYAGSIRGLGYGLDCGALGR